MSKYGSTADYASWISEATGLPACEVSTADIKLSDYDFLVLGSPVYYYEPILKKWIERHMAEIENKPLLFFTVSGAGKGQKLDDWLSRSLPTEFIAKIQHIALRGRMKPQQISWFHRIMLMIGSMFNKDVSAREDERNGFDYMDAGSIEPVVEIIHHLKER